ncbi:MAG: Vgb family protein [Planctomycetota bacterium]|jgi:streptogramin lyase
MKMRTRRGRVVVVAAIFSIAMLWTGCENTDRITGPEDLLDVPVGLRPNFQVVSTNETYTLDADFDQGVLFNVNHDAPNNDQLQLSQVAAPFPFVNVAASSRGTVVRIDVDDGTVLGEYLTAPNGRGRNPSRTTVDLDGNVWVANRAESSGGKGSVTRVGVVIGGTRVTEDETPNASGDYLAPPFQYNTCVDQDGDNLIKTSRTLGDIRPWTNTGGDDDNGGVSTAEDECIINYTRVTGTGTRTVAIDANNDVWVGGTGDRDHEKLDGNTGLPVPGTQFNLSCGGYGGLVDGSGVLWSARTGGLLRFVPNPTPPPAGTGVCLGSSHGDYGLGIDPNTGHIWHTNLSGNRVAELAPDGTLLNAYTHGNNSAQGVAVDGVGNVWVAHSLFNATTVGHLRTDGTFVGNVPLPGGNGPTGVAVDANGKIWVANINSNNAMRIDPAGGSIGGGGFPIGAVDMTVDLGAGAGPYNYSDMTGFVSVGATSPQGTWTVVQDGGVLGTEWGTVTWNGNEPDGGGANITVEARTSDTEAGLGGATFVAVTSGVDFSLLGQFIEVRATLTRASDGTSPILFDLTIETANDPPVCTAASPSVAMLWPPNHKFVPISVQGVTDPDGDPISIVIDAIFQDEPTDTFGDGRFTPDGTGVGTSTAHVRAERSGTKKVPGDGRVYHIRFTASDDSGATCSGTVQVGVPHDQRGTGPVDGGPLHDSTS